jgi:hypothetical protein
MIQDEAKQLRERAAILCDQAVQATGDHKPQFEDFATAIHLIDLLPVSSASKEHVFLQLKLVVDAVDHSCSMHRARADRWA